MCWIMSVFRGSTARDGEHVYQGREESARTPEHYYLLGHTSSPHANEFLICHFGSALCKPRQFRGNVSGSLQYKKASNLLGACFPSVWLSLDHQVVSQNTCWIMSVFRGSTARDGDHVYQGREESARTPEQDLHSHTSPHAKEFFKSDH